MHTVAYSLGAALYMGASVRYATWFAQARPGTPRLAAVLLYVGIACHLAGLAIYWATFGEPPLVGLGPSIATLSLLIVLALAAVGTFSETRAVGLVLTPFAALLLIAAILIGLHPTGLPLSFREPWLAIHTSLSFLGYAAWVVAAAAASMYLVQFRELKHKRLGAVFQFFPALETLDRLTQRSLVLGFSSFTLGILVGSIWTLRFNPAMGPTDPKVLWGLLAWVVLGVAVWMRLSGHRSSREAAVWNVAGFVLVFVAYLVFKAMAPGTRFFL
jgi:ABC-type uncharacterized transport system permease subunit